MTEKKYLIDEEELRHILIQSKRCDFSIDSLIWQFLKSKQPVELFADGEVLIDEEDNEIWIGDPDTDGTPMNSELSKYELENIKLYIEKMKND